MKSEVKKVFDDLDSYRDWCRENGFRFHEEDLYQKRGPHSLMMRERYDGLVIDNQWEKGARIFRRNIHLKGK